MYQYVYSSAQWFRWNNAQGARAEQGARAFHTPLFVRCALHIHNHQKDNDTKKCEL